MRLLARPVDLPSVADHVDDDDCLVSEYFVDDAIVAYSQLVEARKLARQRFWLHRIEVLGEPAHTIDDPTAQCLVETPEVSSCCVQDTPCSTGCGNSQIGTIGGGLSRCGAKLRAGLTRTSLRESS